MIANRASILAVAFICISAFTCFSEQIGKNNVNDLEALAKQVETLIDSEKYTEALPLAKEWVEKTDVLSGTGTTNSAMASSNLGIIYEELGDFGAAEPLYQKCLNIREKILGLEHPDTADALNNLGMLYRKTGNYSAAETMYLKSLQIRRKVLGESNPDTGDSMNNLAVLYRNEGNYAAAEPLFKECLAIWEKSYGPDDPVTATALNNLANLYYTIGNYTAAEPLFQRSLQNVQKLQGTNHLNTAKALNNLAELYRVMGRYTEAEPLDVRSLWIIESRLGTNNPATAEALNNLAELYRNTRRYSEAETLYQQSLRIWESKLGPEHINTATALNNLAVLYRSMGNYPAAEALLERSLAINVKVLGEQNSRTASCLNNLVLNSLGQNSAGSPEDLSLARKAAAANEKAWQNILSFASDAQRMAFETTQSPYLLFANLGSAPDLAERVLRNKALVLDSQIEDEMLAKVSTEPAIHTKVEAFKAKGRKLLKLEIEIPNDQSPEGLNQREQEHAKLEAEVQDLQSDLAKNVASLGQTRRALRVTCKDVQSRLGNSTILIEFLRYNQYLGKTEFAPRYGAIIIASTNNPAWVPLGPATNIEQDLGQYEHMMRGEERGGTSLLKTLFSELMAPIIAKVPTNFTNIIICPDAGLNFLSFATLLDYHDKFLCESYQIKYVSSGRDLVYGRTATNINPQFAIFANPDFNCLSESTNFTTTNGKSLAMFSADRRDYNGVSLTQLPNTDKEAEFLSSHCLGWHLKPSRYSGTQASEAQVKALHSPYILHLASHGFFLADTNPTNQSRILSFSQNAPVVLHNPMQRSGLALAGAQLTLDAWKRGEVPDTENDGILMAEEVGMLDLHNTWLVTLSACDTGIGEARAGEGVMGLRRGFIEAGAQNLLMTLWPVSDKWTTDLMEAFYQKAMVTKDAPGALASVQRDFLKRLRQEKNPVLAARLAGPFVMNFQGKPGSN